MIYFLLPILSPQQILIESLPQKGDSFQHLFSQNPFLFPFCSRPQGNLQQFVILHRLQDKIENLQLQRFLGEFKLIIAGHKNDFHVRKLALNGLGQLQTVHERHPDIRNDNMRPLPLYSIQPFFSVVGRSRDLEAIFLPWNITA
ncbi:hypothetical protein D3C87_1749850 [compost metagenome]